MSMQFILRNRTAAAFALIAATSGCQFYARGPEDYRKDTRAVLETRNAEIQRCYDDVLKRDPRAGGTVVVHFAVEEDTGAIKRVQVLPESSAPAPLGECVSKALEGLALQPPDKREGDATFVWEFRS